MAYQWPTARSPTGRRLGSSGVRPRSDDYWPGGSGSPAGLSARTGHPAESYDTYLSGWPAMGYGRDGTAPNRSAGYGRQDEMVAPRSRRDGYEHAQAGLSRCRDPFRDGHHGDDALAYRARDYGRGSLGREAVAALGRNDDVGTFRSRGFGRDGYRREEAPAPPGSMARGRVDHGQEPMAPARSECYVGEEMQPPMSRGADLHRAAAAAAREPAGASTAPVTGSESSPALGRVLSNKSMTVSTDLDGIAQELRQLTSVSKRADAVLSDAHAEIPTGLRNDLSQLHGHANSLLATRLDAILTGELHSGRDQARARRKDLIRAAEALIERIEQQVRTIDQRTGK